MWLPFTQRSTLGFIGGWQAGHSIKPAIHRTNPHSNVFGNRVFLGYVCIYAFLLRFPQPEMLNPVIGTKGCTRYPRLFSFAANSRLLIHGDSWHNRCKSGFSLTVPSNRFRSRVRGHGVEAF